MKREVREALDRIQRERKTILSGLEYGMRLRLLEQLFLDFFSTNPAMLLKWAALTGQTAQIDTGYAAQHMASILLAVPGQGFRGKGLDLAHGGEVKSANALSGVDRPRWNHGFDTVQKDAERRSKGQATKGEEYLNAPVVVYMLLDQPYEESGVLRVRVWLVDSRKDAAWRELISTFEQGKTGSTYNLQLHPPVGYDDDLITNTLFSLDLRDNKVLEARITLTDKDPQVAWVQKPPETFDDWAGRAIKTPYSERPSRLAGAADVVVGLDGVPELIDDIRQMLGEPAEALLEHVLSEEEAVREEILRDPSSNEG